MLICLLAYVVSLCFLASPENWSIQLLNKGNSSFFLWCSPLVFILLLVMRVDDTPKWLKQLCSSLCSHGELSVLSSNHTRVIVGVQVWIRSRAVQAAALQQSSVRRPNEIDIFTSNRLHDCLVQIVKIKYPPRYSCSDSRYPDGHPGPRLRRERDERATNHSRGSIHSDLRRRLVGISPAQSTTSRCSPSRWSGRGRHHLGGRWRLEWLWR